ncbi:neuropeptides capa receptor-like [Tropilaelaps mercedesae]|uniref:Neuropeptides capa receptor-like n=1 Tax=Tropilaelaps mercedesae TaxID=418985 RepID=A0A1V9XFV3_9ACAR|nr:neuropeptides capa receptor-like [Tropilaelaps mercedesae]
MFFPIFCELRDGRVLLREGKKAIGDRPKRIEGDFLCNKKAHPLKADKEAGVEMCSAKEFAVVISFFVCWTPFHIQRVWAQSLAGINLDDEEVANKQLLTVYAIVHHVSGISYYLSATANPILYQVLSLKFRQAMRDTFSRCCSQCCCGLFTCRAEEQTFTTSFYNSHQQASGFIRSASTRGSTMGRNNFSGNCRSYSPTNNSASDRSGGTRSNKLNNRGSSATVANSDLLPEKDDTSICKPVTDANGLLTVDVAPTIVPISETRDNPKNKGREGSKAKDVGRDRDVNTERLIVLTNNKTNCRNPQVIVTTET